MHSASPQIQSTCCSSITTSKCRKKTEFMEEDEKYLATETKEELLVSSIATCSQKCLSSGKCKATNFCKHRNDIGLHKCQLLQETAKDRTSQLNVSSEWIHLHTVSKFSFTQI